MIEINNENFRKIFLVHSYNNIVRLNQILML
jgi:hypothetical protein